MRLPVAFAVALVVTFGAAFGIGRVVPPIVTVSDSPQPVVTGAVPDTTTGHEMSTGSTHSG